MIPYDSDETTPLESRSAPDVADVVDMMGEIWEDEEAVGKAHPNFVIREENNTSSMWVEVWVSTLQGGFSLAKDVSVSPRLFAKARQHPTVVAFEAKHRALPSAANLDANAEEERVRAATSRPPCQATLDDTLDCQAPDCPCAKYAELDADAGPVLTIEMEKRPVGGWFPKHQREERMKELGITPQDIHETTPPRQGQPKTTAKPADWEEARDRVKAKHPEAEYAERGNQQSVIWSGEDCVGCGWDEPSAWLDAASRLSANRKDERTKCGVCNAENACPHRGWVPPPNWKPNPPLSTSGAGLETQAERPCGPEYAESLTELLLDEDAPDASRPTRTFFNAAVRAAYKLGQRPAKPEEAPDAGFLEWITELARLRYIFHLPPLSVSDRELARAAWIAARKGGRCG